MRRYSGLADDHALEMCLGKQPGSELGSLLGAGGGADKNSSHFTTVGPAGVGEYRVVLFTQSILEAVGVAGVTKTAQLDQPFPGSRGLGSGGWKRSGFGFCDSFCGLLWSRRGAGSRSIQPGFRLGPGQRRNRCRTGRGQWYGSG